MRLAAVAVESAYYTRAGAFRVDSTGLNLVNPDNYKVLDEARTPVVFAPTAVVGGNTLNFQKVVGTDAMGALSLLYADANGNSATLYYNGNGATTAAYPGVRIGVATVPNPPGLLKTGGTLYQIGTGASGSGTPTVSNANGTTQKVLSNNLEMSNVDMATEFVNLITTQRAYSANSKTITTADEMTQEVLSLKR